MIVFVELTFSHLKQTLSMVVFVELTLVHSWQNSLIVVLWMMPVYSAVLAYLCPSLTLFHVVVVNQVLYFKTDGITFRTIKFTTLLIAILLWNLIFSILLLISFFLFLHTYIDLFNNLYLLLSFLFKIAFHYKIFILFV